MIMKEYADLKDLIAEIKEGGDKILTDLDLDTKDTISKANGYKIFWIGLEIDDPYFQPDDYHGMRLYTYVSNKFKDCKSIAIPIVSFKDVTEERAKNRGYRSTQDAIDFYTEFNSGPQFLVYVGNSYLNILTHFQDLITFFDNETGEVLDGSSVGIILISDGMYKNRSYALDKLLSLSLET